MSLTFEQQEELRQALLQAAVIRAPAALTIRQLARAVRKELPFLFEDEHVEAACQLLRGLAPSLMDFTVEQLGSTKYWRATSEGVLHVERS